MTTLDQLDHQEDELRNPTGLSDLENAIREGRKPNPDKEEPTWPEMIKGGGDEPQISETDRNVNSVGGVKTPENPGKEEPTWQETVKEIGDNPEASKYGDSIRDLIIRRDQNWEINPEKEELVSELADKAEQYFNDNKDSLDEKEYKSVMQALWIFVNMQWDNATKYDNDTKSYQIDHDKIISFLDEEKGFLWIALAEPKEKDILKNFLNYLKPEN